MYQKDSMGGTGQKEWKFFKVTEGIIGLKIVPFCMKRRKGRMRPVFLLGFVY